MKYQHCKHVCHFNDTPISRSFFCHQMWPKIESDRRYFTASCKKNNTCISFLLMLIIIFHLFWGSSERAYKNAGSIGEEKHRAGGVGRGVMSQTLCDITESDHHKNALLVCNSFKLLLVMIPFIFTCFAINAAATTCRVKKMFNYFNIMPKQSKQVL